MEPLVKVPAITAARLAKYLDRLKCLEEREITVVSSKELARDVGVSPFQVRKDLSYFGGFGRRGVGYDVSSLKRNLMKILGSTEPRPVVVVGAGYLGAAIYSCPELQKRGFYVVGIFEHNPFQVTREFPGIEILPMENLADVVREYGVEVGVLTVPRVTLQKDLELLKRIGIKKVLTFGWCSFGNADDLEIVSVDLLNGLEMLFFKKKGCPPKGLS
ncbi:MAG: redox-sensing transcriptional repressor Rex [Bacillota bacterium]